jgi:hypothetical protein
MLAAFFFGDKGNYHDLAVEHHVKISRTGNRHSLCKTALSFQTVVNDAEKCGFDDLATSSPSSPFQSPALPYYAYPALMLVSCRPAHQGEKAYIHCIGRPCDVFLPSAVGGRYSASRLLIITCELVKRTVSPRSD